jgi:hypothetical protein
MNNKMHENVLDVVSKIQTTTTTLTNTTFKKRLTIASFIVGTYFAARIGLFGTNVHEFKLAKDQRIDFDTNVIKKSYLPYYDVKINAHIHGGDFNPPKEQKSHINMRCIRPFNVVLNRSPWRENETIKIN